MLAHQAVEKFDEGFLFFVGEDQHCGEEFVTGAAAGGFAFAFGSDRAVGFSAVGSLRFYTKFTAHGVLSVSGG